ncbi:MAG TPA: hypothetical protein VLF66_19960, partial [Thermoanaerobaculia bacterium]|nr:hypothetical protein [Thermoanaerobaculia bacterium]
RLTRLADLRSPDPLPGVPPRAVAVRNRHGFSQIVTVDLGTGVVRPLTEPSVEEVWARPRVSPDGRRLAAVRLAEGAWRLVTAELEPDDGGAVDLGPIQELPSPDGATVTDPAWSPDGRTLYASVGTGGFLDLWAFDLDAGAGGAGGAEGRPLTRTPGAALAPAPTPDGEALFYLALEHDGLDVWRLELGRRATGPPYDSQRPELPAELAPAILPPADAEVEPFGEAELPEDRPYGLGPQEVTPLAGLALAPSGLALEAGARGGDVVGRLDWLLLGSLGHAGAVEGGVLAAAWRGLPVELTGALFATSEEPSAQDSPPPGAGRSLDVERTGLALAAGWDRRFPGGAVALRLGLLGAEVAPLRPGGGEAVDTAAATLRVGLAWAPSRGRWSLPLQLAGALQEGETDSEPWRRWRLRAGAGVTRDQAALRLAWERHGSDDVQRAFDRFQVGGVRRSLLPDDADFARVPAPALPAGWLVGDEHETQRVELALDALPAPLFFERHRVWSDGGAKGDWLSLAGVELDLALPPSPLLALPAARLTAGAAYVLDDPAGDLADEVRLWAALVWRP